MSLYMCMSNAHDSTWEFIGLSMFVLDMLQLHTHLSHKDTTKTTCYVRIWNNLVRCQMQGNELLAILTNSTQLKFTQPRSSYICFSEPRTQTCHCMGKFTTQGFIVFHKEYLVGWQSEAIPLCWILCYVCESSPMVNINLTKTPLSCTHKNTFSALESRRSVSCPHAEHDMLLTDRGWVWEVPLRQVVDISQRGRRQGGDGDWAGRHKHKESDVETTQNTIWPGQVFSEMGESVIRQMMGVMTTSHF